MIYVDIKGNIGNQMFIYALARHIQIVTGQKIQLNLFNLKKNRPDMTFNLLGFNLKGDYVVEENRKLPWYADSYNTFNRIVRKIIPSLQFDILSKFGVYMWLKASYKKIVLKQHKNYFISGYFQSSDYFYDCQSEILREFSLCSTSNNNKLLYNNIINSESVCVTIRRGDYVTNDVFRKKLYICDETYFQTAMNSINKDLNNVTFFAFSDDIEWVKKNVSFPGDVFYETGNDDVFEKLRLMSACKHFILSNSSFSWWAYKLSDYKDKIVYAPSRWMNDERECAIYEDGWKLISGGEQE